MLLHHHLGRTSGLHRKHILDPSRSLIIRGQVDPWAKAGAPTGRAFRRMSQPIAEPKKKKKDIIDLTGKDEPPAAAQLLRQGQQLRLDQRPTFEDAFTRAPQGFEDAFTEAQYRRHASGGMMSEDDSSSGAMSHHDVVDYGYSSGAAEEQSSAPPQATLTQEEQRTIRVKAERTGTDPRAALRMLSGAPVHLYVAGDPSFGAPPTDIEEKEDIARSVSPGMITPQAPTPQPKQKPRLPARTVIRQQTQTSRPSGYDSTYEQGKGTDPTKRKPPHRGKSPGRPARPVKSKIDTWGLGKVRKKDIGKMLLVKFNKAIQKDETGKPIKE